MSSITLPDGMERRFVDFSQLGRPEMRAADGDEDGVREFVGHAAVFGQRTLIGSKRFGFLEEVAPRAFAEVLDRDTRFLHNHNPDLLLARTTNGSLRLAEDKVGLLARADFAPTSLARDLEVLLDRGDVTQMSFAFRVAQGGDTWSRLAEDDPDYDPDFPDLELRVVNRYEELYDVSTVTYAAYPQTDAGLRSLVCAGVLEHVQEARGSGSGTMSEDDKAAQAAMLEARQRFLKIGDSIHGG